MGGSLTHSWEVVNPQNERGEMFSLWKVAGITFTPLLSSGVLKSFLDKISQVFPSVSQIYCCTGFLSLTGQLHQVNADLLGWWLCERQLPSGGLNGRPEKVCAFQMLNGEIKCHLVIVGWTTIAGPELQPRLSVTGWVPEWWSYTFGWSSVGVFLIGCCSSKWIGTNVICVPYLRFLEYGCSPHTALKTKKFGHCVKHLTERDNLLFFLT